MPAWTPLRTGLTAAGAVVVVGGAVLVGGVFGADSLASRWGGAGNSAPAVSPPRPSPTPSATPSVVTIPTRPEPTAAASRPSSSSAPSRTPLPGSTAGTGTASSPAAPPSASASPTPRGPFTTGLSSGPVRLQVLAANTHVLVRDKKGRVLLDALLERGRREYFPTKQLTILVDHRSDVRLRVSGNSKALRVRERR